MISRHDQSWHSPTSPIPAAGAQPHVQGQGPWTSDGTDALSALLSSLIQRFPARPSWKAVRGVPRASRGDTGGSLSIPGPKRRAGPGIGDPDPRPAPPSLLARAMLAKIPFPDWLTDWLPECSAAERAGIVFPRGAQETRAEVASCPPLAGALGAARGGEAHLSPGTPA